MKTFIVTFLAAILICACDKQEDSEFVNQLSLGTGVDPSNLFKLTGENTIFYTTGGSLVIYFRLESENDMEGNDVLLDFETTDGNPINTISRQQAQNYGHIMVSSFEWMWMTGTYVIKA